MKFYTHLHKFYKIILQKVPHWSDHGGMISLAWQAKDRLFNIFYLIFGCIMIVSSERVQSLKFTHQNLARRLCTVLGCKWQVTALIVICILKRKLIGCLLQFFIFFFKLSNVGVTEMNYYVVTGHFLKFWEVCINTWLHWNMKSLL